MSAELKPIRSEVDEDLVKKIEGVLERVKSGETTGYLILEQKRGITSWSCYGLKNRFEIMGYLAHAIIQMEKP